MAWNGKRTREYLADYRSIQRIARSQEKLVAALKTGLYTLQSSGGTVKGSGIGDPTGNKVLRLDEEEYMLRQVNIVLLWHQKMIDCYLSTIADPMVKLILVQHYVVGRTWKQISVTYGAGQSEDSIRMIAVRYTNRHPISWIL